MLALPGLPPTSATPFLQHTPIQASVANSGISLPEAVVSPTWVAGSKCQRIIFCWKKTSTNARQLFYKPASPLSLERELFPQQGELWLSVLVTGLSAKMQLMGYLPLSHRLSLESLPQGLLPGQPSGKRCICINETCISKFYRLLRWLSV